MISFFLVLWCTLAGVGGAHASAGKVRPPPVSSLEAAADVDDPRALRRAARHWLDAGDMDLARGLFERALDREELLHYAKLRSSHREALILEAMGQHEAAARQWRTSFGEDLQTSILLLRMASSHPDREGLVVEAIDEVRSRVARAKAGEKVQTYTTSKGAPRYLTVIPDDEAVSTLLKSKGRLSYCYIENLDLSADAAPEMPPVVALNRCIVGNIRIPDREFEKLQLKVIVLGELSVGKTWAGAVNKSATIGASQVQDIMVRESVVLGDANFQDLHSSGRIAYFVLSSFEGAADFRDTRIDGMADFRFSVFRQGANLKGARLLSDVYFGHSRYIGPASFRGMYSEQDLYFDSTVFEDTASFDKCEWVRGATFENSRFAGPVSFNSTKMGGRLNMSRAVFENTLTVKEMELAGMDLIGSELRADASFVDVSFQGKVRFSLDDVTRARHLGDPTPLLSLYRDYQGDKDAPEPLTTQSSYGVEHVDDLVARVDGNLSFANSVFRGFVIFERVQFGQPGMARVAQFYNTQFGGETHFERTTWHAVADFTTIFANELSLNEATFHHSLILDDANITGRATLTDAVFAEDADLSFYGAEISTFQIDQGHIDPIEGKGHHRLFYERCAIDDDLPRGDIRLSRLLRGQEDLPDDALRQICYDRVIDEFVGLKQSFGDRAMTDAEDWSYWWIKHHELMKDLRHGSLYERVKGVIIGWLVFELSFGWGVRLGNLGICVLAITVLFAVLYRVFCPETIVQYKGDDVPMREIPWEGLIYISLQTLGAFNTGWDFGEDDWRFQYLNTLQTYLGYIILTFFVGAYTRMILA